MRIHFTSKQETSLASKYKLINCYAPDGLVFNYDVYIQITNKVVCPKSLTFTHLPLQPPLLVCCQVICLAIILCHDIRLSWPKGLINIINAAILLTTGSDLVID